MLQFSDTFFCIAILTKGTLILVYKNMPIRASIKPSCSKIYYKSISRIKKPIFLKVLSHFLKILVHCDLGLGPPKGRPNLYWSFPPYQGPIKAFCLALQTTYFGNGIWQPYFISSASRIY